MEEIHNQEVVSTDKPAQPAEEELSHSDKIIGIFTSPAATYDKMSKFPPRKIDWLLPVCLTIVFAILSQIAMMSNAQIKDEIRQKQIAQMEKSLNSAVEKGQMSREMADERLEKTQENIDAMGNAGIIFQIIGTIFVVLISFFVVTGVYFLFAKFVLKGDGTYNSAMSANGMSYYIAIVGILLMTIASLAMSKFLTSTSVAAFMGMDKSSFTGMLASKLDVISIWALAVTSIGFAKMFQAKSAVRYYVMIFGIWIVWSFITFGIAKAVPALSFLSM